MPAAEAHRRAAEVARHRALDRPVPALALEAAVLPAEAAVGAETGPEIVATTAAAGPGRRVRPADGPAATRPAAGGDAAVATAVAAAAALPVVVGAAALVRR